MKKVECPYFPQPALGAIGFAVLIATAIGMRSGLPPFATHTYELVWWSTVALLDAAIWLRRGRSPLLGSPGRLLVLSLWSVAFWFLFELANLRLRNWYYIFVGAGTLERWWGSFLCFATVLPGVMLAAELVGERMPRRMEPPPPDRLPRRLLAASVALGIFFLVLPLIWPHYYFPLIWGSLFFLLEPLNYRAGGFSFLREAERGSFRAAGRFLLAGLLCGLWWELWNYWARIKWIYTVPFFEEGKLFEMPLLGFLGFPPFALECAAAVAALERFGLLPAVPADGAGAVGGEPAREPRWASGLARQAAIALLAAAATAGLALPAMDRLTFAALYPELAAYEEIPADLRRDLAAAGARDGFDLRARLRAGDSRLAPHRGLIELSLHAGIGVGKARALLRSGVESIAALAAADPDSLHVRLAAQPLRHRPTPAEVRVWIRAARRAGASG